MCNFRGELVVFKISQFRQSGLLESCGSFVQTSCWLSFYNKISDDMKLVSELLFWKWFIYLHI